MSSEVNWDGDVPTRSTRSAKPAGAVQVELDMLAKNVTSRVLATVVVIDGAVAVADDAPAAWPPLASIGVVGLTPL